MDRDGLMGEWKSLPCSGCGRTDDENMDLVEAAERRAERAEQELDDKTVALGEAESWITRYAIERDQARSRAERAEAALTEMTAARTKAMTALARAQGDQADLRATVQRVRALANQFQSERPSKIANVHFVASAILAALDAQRPAERVKIIGTALTCDCGHEFEPRPDWFHLSSCRYRRSFQSVSTNESAQRPAEEESTPGFGTVTRADMEFVAAVTNAPAAREVDLTPTFEDDDWSQRPAEGGPEGEGAR
jgi:hypothetical protein